MRQAMVVLGEWDTVMEWRGAVEISLFMRCTGLEWWEMWLWVSPWSESEAQCRSAAFTDSSYAGACLRSCCLHPSHTPATHTPATHTPACRALQNVINQFGALAGDPRVSFFGNVLVGRDVALQELRQLHHAVRLGGALGGGRGRSRGTAVACADPGATP